MYVLGGEVNFQRQSIAAGPRVKPPRGRAAAMLASLAMTDGVNKGQNG